MIHEQNARLHGIDRILFVIVSVALITFPALVLSLPNAANTAFSVLLGWSVFELARQRRSGVRDWWSVVKAHWPVMLAMSALPASLLLHQLANGARPDIPYLYLRFGLFVVLAWGLLQLRGDVLRQFQWGLIVGPIISAVWMHAVALAVQGRPQQLGLYNVIPFSNLTLLMGMLAVVSIGWGRRDDYAGIALKLLSGSAGLYTAYLSSTRGTWVAIPVLVLVVLMTTDRLTARSRTALFVLLTGSVALVGYCSATVRSRVDVAVQHLTIFFSQSVVDTAEGARLQLWSASIEMFKAHPWTGVGPDGFRGAIDAMQRAGDITPWAAAYEHSHNDVLYAAATLGVFGAMAVVAMYVVPVLFFLRHMRCGDPVRRAAAVMGLATSLSFLVFGLTEVMFFIATTNAFYTLILACCFAIVVGRAPQSGSAPAAELRENT